MSDAISPPVVWLNHGFSETFNVIEAIRAELPAAQARILCTHTQPWFPAFQAADIAEVEPRDVKEDGYLAYCVDLIRRHRVRVLIPSRHRRFLVDHRHDLEAAGATLLVAADGPTLHLLDSKARLYHALRGESWVRLPGYRIAHGWSAFEHAVAHLSEQHPVVCFKPTVALFGQGFHVLREGHSPLARLFGNDPVPATHEEVRLALEGQEDPPELMVMEYLPGPERSIDCLAWEGRLIRSIVRLKLPGTGNHQLLEDNPSLREVAARLTGHFRLHGVFNIQFREDRLGRACLLEINPRMSGGLYLACLSGLSLPAWALRLALGQATADQVPAPRTGIHVGQTARAVALRPLFPEQT